MRQGGAWKRAGGGLIAAGTITAQSQIVIDGLTGYEAYELYLHLPAASAANDLSMRLRKAGVTDTSASYDNQKTYGASTSIGATPQVGQTQWAITGGARNSKTFIGTLRNLNRAEATFLDGKTLDRDAPFTFPQTVVSAAQHRLEQAFDGILIAASTGNVTGRYEVRGA